MRMNSLSLLTAAGAFLAAGAVLVPINAMAGGAYGSPTCCVGYYDHTYNDRGNDHVIGQLTERINAMELAIIEALRLGTGQLSGNVKEQIGADSNMANVQDDRAVVGRVEQARLEAITAAASGSSSCNVITGGIGGTGIESGSLTFAQDFSSGMSDWATGAEGMPSADGTEVAIQQRLNLHCSLYANDQDVRSGLCEAEGSLINANIDATQSIFYHADGSVSGTLDEERIKAAHAFLINAINPKPVGAMVAGQADSPGGRELAAERQADASRISIAADAAGEILARRTPQSDSTFVSYTQETASKIPGYQGNFDEGVSWYDFMDVRARGWYMNPSWAVAMDTQHYGQAIKDSALIQSYDAYLGWETYKLMEKQTLILATMLSILTEQNRATN